MHGNTGRHGRKSQRDSTKKNGCQTSNVLFNLIKEKNIDDKQLIKQVNFTNKLKEAFQNYKLKTKAGGTSCAAQNRIYLQVPKGIIMESLDQDSPTKLIQAIEGPQHPNRLGERIERAYGYDSLDKSVLR